MRLSLGNTYGADWLEKSTDAEYRPAIEAICRIGQDKLAPAALRDAKAVKCSELKAKYPAG